MGEPQKAITRYGLSSASAFTGGRGREKVWPGRGMGSPQTNPSSLSRGGGKDTYFTYQHKGGLVLCPCVSQWGCPAPPPFWCWTHQHPGRQSTQQKFLWVSQPTGGLPTPSLGWGGDIPRGPEWRFRTSAGHSAKATTLGDGVHQWEHLIADNSSQDHPGRLSRSSSSMVIDTGFLPALCYKVPQQSSHWSHLDKGDCRPLIEPHVQNARGILHSQFPLFNGQEEGNPLIQKRYSRVTWSNHLPPLMSLHRQILLTSHPIPAAPSHTVLQRGTPTLLLSHHQPTPSTY